jgi:hypothetical protein
MIRLSALDPIRIGAQTGPPFALFHIGRCKERRAAAMKSIQSAANVASVDREHRRTRGFSRKEPPISVSQIT